MPKIATTLDQIEQFLTSTTTPHSESLIADWHRGLETQVLVNGIGGQKVEGKHNTWTNGLERWWNIRIPRNADSDPEWTDRPLEWVIGEHAEAIGTTWWDWQERRSRKVVADFDIITGHAPGVGISESELEDVRGRLTDIPYVTLRRSTSGSGLHCYVNVDVATENHTVHAALARCILGMMSTDADFDFQSPVDQVGGNIWIWHRTKLNHEEGSFEVIKQSDVVLTESDLPRNWRDHEEVIKGKRKRLHVRGIKEAEYDAFEALASGRKVIRLDDTHRAIIDELQKLGYETNWVPDHHLLQTHTFALQLLMDDPQAIAKLGLKGVFKTTSPGTDPGTPNCFAFPLHNGAFKVFRFGKGVQEHEIWDQDGQKWTQCIFNREPGLHTAAVLHGGTNAGKKRGFVFQSAEALQNTVQLLGGKIEIPVHMLARVGELRRTADGELAAKISRESNDTCPHGWFESGKFWETTTGVTCGEPHDDDEGQRKFNDPILLAEQYIAKTATEDGSPTFANFRGETYAYVPGDGWERVAIADVEPAIRASVQESFDERARRLSQLEGKPVKAEPIRGQLIPDTFKAIQSLCHYKVSKLVQPPLWLSPHEDWEADDLLTFQNGILNIRRFIEGRDEFFIPPTPKLFSEYHAAFDFDPNAPQPTEWFRFLDSLEQDETWRKCLQQIMGSGLWLNYDLQKYFHFVGPPRSGKGTILGVEENLVGGAHAVCSPRLKDFGTDFGLENAIGKRLAFVPEIDMPKDNQREIVSRLKAITGGDAVDLDRKHKAKVSLRLRIKIIMSTNHFVALPDNSGALQARMIPLKLTKSFRGQEDIELADKLKSEYPGILLWALDGLRSLYADGRFTLPQSSLDALRELEDASAPLQSFVDECCTVDLQKGVHSPALHDIYKCWLKEAQPDEHPMNEGPFAEALRDTVLSVHKARATADYQRDFSGVKIVETQFDSTAKRPSFWLGICPKLEWCHPDARKALVVPAPHVTLPVANVDPTLAV